MWITLTREPQIANLMKHSGYIYLMTPKGAYEAVFTEKRDTPVKIAAAIKQRL